MDAAAAFYSDVLDDTFSAIQKPAEVSSARWAARRHGFGSGDFINPVDRVRTTPELNQSNCGE